MDSYADMDAPPSGEPRGRSASRSPPRRSYRDDDRSPPARSRSRSRTRSRSPPPRRDTSVDAPRGRRRSPPIPERPRHAPKDVDPTNVVGVFGLSIRTLERDLHEEFERVAPVDKVVIVYDARTDRSRGFGFVTMKDIEGAQAVIKSLNGIDLHGRRIRVDFSATKRPHSPTPGEYRGNIRPDDRFRGGAGPPGRGPRGGGGGAWPPPPRHGWGGGPPPPPSWGPPGGGGGYGRYGPPPPERWGPPPPLRSSRYDDGYPRRDGPDASSDWRRRPTPPRRGGSDRGRDLSPPPRGGRDLSPPPRGGRDASPPSRARRHRDSPSPPPRKRDSRSPPRRRNDDY